MVITMAFMGMMQVAIDQIINVVAVWNRFVATARAMNVVSTMASALMAARANRRILLSDVDLVLGNFPVRFLVIQVAIMQVIDMITMLDWHMSTSIAMNMIWTFLLTKHKCFSARTNCLNVSANVKLGQLPFDCNQRRQTLDYERHLILVLAYWIVDAFADCPFTGNPAAVVVPSNLGQSN